MSKKAANNQEPIKYELSMYCKIAEKTVTLDIDELINGYPLKTRWKRVNSCNCNHICNPKDPKTFPKRCPAVNIQISLK